MKMKRTQFAAVIAGGDGDNAPAASGADAFARGVFDSGVVQAVHHNFIDGLHVVGNCVAANARSVGQ